MFKEIIKPTLVLMIIAAVVAGMLAFTYNITGVGELGNSIPQEELDTIMPEVIPGATKLKLSKAKVEDPAFLGVYSDEGGKGHAIHIAGKGYSDGLMVLVGLDNDGVVTGLKIISSQETNGIGTKIEDPAFLAQFVGKSKSVTVDKGGDVEIIAGATKSSQGLGNAVNLAFKFFEEVKGDLE